MVTKRRGRRTPSSSKKTVTIIICIIAAILILAAVFLLFTNILKKQTTPEDVAKDYFAKLTDKKYEEMYSFLSEEAQQTISKEDFVKRNQNIYEGIGASDIKITFPEENTSKKDGGTATITYGTTMQTTAGEYRFDNQMTLKRGSDREYKIQWDSTLIFPALEDTDKVKVKTMEAKRGTIYDRNHVELAKQGTIAQVGIVPGKLDADRDAAFTQIASILGITPDDITKALSASWVTDEVFVPIKKIAASDVGTQNALVGEDGTGSIPGVAIQNIEGRVYPLGEKAGHLTGYIQSITAEQLEEKQKDGYHEGSVIGKSGLEKLYEEELRAIDGSEIYIADKDGEKKETLCLKAPQNGNDITVTIDYLVQQRTYDEFTQDAATAVAMNPKTGELLALVSTPGINPNEFVMGMSGARWDEMNNNPLTPLTNRYLNAWVPGSTFKPITASIGVDTGKLDPNENKGNVGLAWQKDGSWGNYKVTTLTDYGSEVNMQNALIYSDNIYFAKAALDIGSDLFAEGLKKMGFGEEMPIDLKLQTSTFDDDNQMDNEIQLADSGYGQGKVLVNPVHLASIYSAFVNEGNMILPVLRMKDDFTPSYWKEQVMTPDTASLIAGSLTQVIENPKGTGSAAKIEGVSLLGKTGTAETKASQEESGAKEFGWFACETLEETANPITVIAMVEDIQSKGIKQYINTKVRAIIEDYVK